MIILISGASHTGKTNLSQKLLEKYKYPYLSIDHLKMGLIRSGQTNLTPCDDDKLTDYLWPIVSEMIKTAIENDQNMIVEGCYIPFDWKNSFDEHYLEKIKYVCLVLSEEYIKLNFDKVIQYESIVEKRLFSDYTLNMALDDNKFYLENCIKYNLNHILVENEYNIDRKIENILHQ